MYICFVKLEQAIKSSNFKSELHKASINLLYTAWWLKTLVSKNLKQIDFTQEQFNVMRILKGKHPDKMSVKDIASRMIEQNSNVPRIIDRLEKKSWINRIQCPNDGRHTKIGLSPLGISKLAEASTLVEEATSNVLKLDSNEAGQLNILLEKMRES